MTPVSLNYLPGPSSIQDHQSDADHLFIHNHDQPTTLSSPTTAFFQILDPPQIIHHHQEDEKVVFEYGGSSSNHHNQVCNINNSASVEPVIVRDYENSACGYGNSCNFYDKSLENNDEEENKNVHGSDGGKYWMSSKMRLTRKMIMKKSPSTNGYSQTNPSNYNGNNSITRVCSDCHTSTTPLWRSGPKGPKSLCNACGIRQRKARRAMAEAIANGSFATSMDASFTKPKVHHHKEKSRTNHFARLKNKCKATTTAVAGTSQRKVKLDFKDFAISLRSEEGFQQVFPMDDVAEAALLLMDLSCGFVYF